MKILITGGCGFIGTNICLEAKNRGHDVIAFDSLIRNGVEENILILKKAGIKIFRGDIRDLEDLSILSSEYGLFNGIIHLAANPGIPRSISNPKYDFEVNAVGTVNMLEFARKNNNCPFIFASTNKVYSDLINEIEYTARKKRYLWNKKNKIFQGWSYEGINESFNTDGYGKYPHSPYGISKLTGDHYCQEYFHTYGLPVVINRMGCIYGYYQKGVADQGWIDWFIRSIGFGKREITIYGDGKQVRDMLWGEDVARLYIDELEHINEIQGEIFNVGGGKENTLSLIEAINEVETVSRKKAILNYKDWRHADQKIYISDTKKIKEKLNWKPTISPKEGIALMYNKYKLLY